MPLKGANEGYLAQLHDEVKPLVMGESAARFLGL